MSLAEDTREAVRRHPFLLAALRADVVNYTAAARFLPVDGEAEAVATALRRFAEGLPDRDPADRTVRVEMLSGVGEVTDADGDPLFALGDLALAPDSGSFTAILATGEVDAAALAHALGRLAAAEVEVVAAGVGDECLLVAVERRDGPDALRTVEDALASVPGSGQ